MRFPSRPGVGVLLLAAMLMPRPGAAGVTHPLDPSARPAGVPTKNVFDGYIPLLDRDEPVPSFIVDGPSASSPPAAEPEPTAMPAAQGGPSPAAAE